MKIALLMSFTIIYAFSILATAKEDINSYDEAKTKSSALNKPILLDFYTDT